MWKILQINWSNVILKSSWSSSWIRFRPLTPSALPQIHKNSLKAPLKADNQSQWLIVHCLHPNDTIWSWTCSSLHLWPEKWSGVPAAAACPPSPPHAGALDAHRPRSVSQRWSRAIRGNRLPAELPETGVFMTSSERRCQRPAASAEDRVCHRPVLHVGFRRRDGRHQLAWKRLTAATVPSAHVDQYLLQWKRDRVQTRSLRVCVCVCVCVCHHVSQSGGWDHDMTQQVHMLKTWRVILLSKKFWAFPKGNLIWNFWLSILKSTWDSSANKQHKHF